MGYWRRHSKKELEGLLQEFHEAGWVIRDPVKKYYHVRCPCGDHKRSIHLTPSNPHYSENARHWLHRQPCYKERGGNP